MDTTTAETVTREQIAVVRGMKALDAPSRPRKGLAIVHEDGTVLGNLVPIDRELADDPQVAEKLTAWRQRFMEFFMTQFPATAERTGRWLREVVLPDDTRLLFLIQDDTGRWVGNFGVCGVASQTAELDNLIRGEKGGHARLIYYSELTLMRWLYRTMDVATIRLRVFSHNRVTLRLHRSVGFVQRRVLPLGVERDGETTRYFDDPDPRDTRAEFDLVEMTMDREEFFARYVWLEE